MEILRNLSTTAALVVISLLGCLGPNAQAETAGEGTIAFAILGEDQRPLPCRIHVKDQRANPRFPPQLPHFANHFVCPGKAELHLSADDYTFEIERGPEYARQSGTFHLGAGEAQHIERRLKRTADMAAKGWYSGDLHVHRSLEQVPLLMQAEDLHVAPVITWWNNVNLWKDRRPPTDLLTRFDGNRFFHAMAGEDEREGGALLYFGLDQPLAITGSSREYPSPMKFVQEARRRPGVWIDIEKPFWWDVPVWLASGRVDSMGLANNHMCRSSMSATEAWGKPRDAARLPPPRGNGYWSQEIYYHVLNSGLRIPPSAGSASGVLPNPVGYNRVYVYVGRDMTYQRWWEGLKAGRSFVTNGPLLLVRANEQLPGHVFTAPEGEKVVVRLEVELVSADRVPVLEVVVDGRVCETISPEQLAAGRPLSITFARSGWFLVRAITDVPHTFRFASTAPYYVEIGPAKRTIHRSSVQFFLDWLDERAQRVSRTLHDPAELEEVLEHHRRAKQFWRARLAEADAE
jgi:hypothetical protein